MCIGLTIRFDVRWAFYKRGFGRQGENKEFWLGNENVYQLVKALKVAKLSYGLKEPCLTELVVSLRLTTLALRTKRIDTGCGLAKQLTVQMAALRMT